MIAEKLFNLVVEQMIRRYKTERLERKSELMKKHRADDVLFVHELVQCPLKRVYAAKYPDIEDASIYNPRFVVGQMIEDAAKLYLSSEMDLEDRTFEKVVEVNGRKIVVAGSMDAYVSDGNAIEIKYLTGLYNTPHEHHVKQLAIYLNLAGLQKGELLQISPEGIKSVEVGPISDEELLAAVDNALRLGEAPLWDWECRLCWYEFLCNRSLAREKK